MKRTVVATVVALAVFPVWRAAAEPFVPYPTTPSNMREAQADAAAWLRDLELPVGSTRSDSDPSGANGSLGQPGFVLTGRTSVIDDAEWWVVPTDPASTLRWIRLHPPPGADLTVAGGSLSAVKWIAYTRPRVFNRLGWRSLSIAVTQLSDGSTGIRADGQSAWLYPRPASSFITNKASYLTVGLKGHRAAEVLGPARTHDLANLVNGLELPEPGVIVLSCPPTFPFMTPTIRLVFRAHRHGAPLAVARVIGTSCPQLRLRIGHAPEVSLDMRFGGELEDELRSILHFGHAL